MSLFYRPENAWVGDLIPYYEDGTFYAYYLHDPRIIEGNMQKKPRGIWRQPKTLSRWIIKEKQSNGERRNLTTSIITQVQSLKTLKASTMLFILLLMRTSLL